MSSADAPAASPSPVSPAVDVNTNLEVNDNIDEDNKTAPIEPTLPSMDGSNDALDTRSPTTLAADPTTTDPAGNVSAKAEEGLRPEIVEPRIPAKKDATLREFLGKMDDYAPIIPDAVTAHYLTLAGLPPPPETPLPLARLLALATQKFIADIAADAYQYARIRTGHTTSNTAAANAASLAGLPGGVGVPGMPGAVPEAGGAGANKGKDAKGVQLGVQRPGYGGGGQGGQGQGRTVLTMEDLGCAVGEYGVNVKRGEFYR